MDAETPNTAPTPLNSKLLRLGWWVAPILPLAMFFLLPTLALAALAALAVLLHRKPLKVLFAVLPVLAFLGALAAQIVAGLLCMKTLTLLVIVAAAVATLFSLRRAGMHRLAALVPLVAGSGLGFLEWPFFIVGPVVAALLFWLAGRETFIRAGRWLPLASMTSLCLLVVNITWYAGIEEHAADSYAQQPGVEKIFGYDTGKKLGAFTANRARYLMPLPDGSLALGVRGGEQAVLRLQSGQIEPLGAGHYATDNAVPLPDGLITGDIRSAMIYRFGGEPLRQMMAASAAPDQIGILRLAGDDLFAISANRHVVQTFSLVDFSRGREFPIGHLCSDLDIVDGTLFVATFVGGRVIALDAEDGGPRWVAMTGNLLQQNVAVSDDAVYATGFLPGRVMKLDRTTGEYLAVRDVPPGLRYCVYDAATDTFAASDFLAGEIVLFDGDTLETKARVRVGRRPRWLEPDGRGGILVVGAAGGFRLDLSSVSPVR